MQKKEIIIGGLNSAPGIAIGKSFVYNPVGIMLSTKPVSDDEKLGERDKYFSAKRIIQIEIKKIAQLSDDRLDDDARRILDIGREILDDPELEKGILNRIDSDAEQADRAVYEEFQKYIDRLNLSGNSFFRERIIDLRDIRDRLVRAIQQKSLLMEIKDDSLVVSKDISPSEIIQFARRNIKAMASEQGGLTSHASIIANSMGIPFVLGAKDLLDRVECGDQIIVDGNAGRVIINPAEETLEDYKTLQRIEAETDKSMREIARNPGQTKDGQRIVIQANVELEAEIDRIQKYHAEGIGLLRTEAYFFDGDSDKGVHDQEVFLRRAAEACGTNGLTVRLFDVGGDKFPDYAKQEKNPFLGWRGVRILLDKREMLRSQLRLILNQNFYKGPLQIMVPMITNVEEVLEVKDEIEKMTAAGELKKTDWEFGIMIEVPSAAILAEHIAPHVDFFSIGTNDLTQYTLAADRGNPLVQSLYRYMHPAVWRLIRLSNLAAQRSRIPVSVCGELASDPGAACLLVGLGVRKLSMAAPAVPAVKKMLRKFTSAELEKYASQVTSAKSVTEAAVIRHSLLDEYELRTEDQ